MQKYEIVLKNEKVRLYNRLGWFIVAIHIIVFLYFSISANTKYISTGYIASLILLFLAFLIKYYLYKTKSRWQMGVESFFFLLIIAWISNHQYWLAGIPAAFSILSSFALRKFIVIFTEQKIVYPSLPKKTFQWKELNNTILKDGILTIDLKSNKIIQQIIDESSSSINEKEFNEFCRQQLIISNQKQAT